MFSHRIKLENKLIGDGQPTFIIAEAGVNHNGKLELAKRLIIEAKKTGADCVKFQTFRAENLVTRNAPKAMYQLKVTDPQESQYDMLKKLELPFDAYVDLIKLCQEVGIFFLSTPYNFIDVDFLDKAGVGAYKLASMHLTESPFLIDVARRGKPVFLSSGMGTMSDIISAAEIFSRAGNENLVLLQCTTDYPASLAEANLRAISSISRNTGALVGYSDNSDSVDACVLAVAAGACVVEKHFTIDKNLPGPDQRASANPVEFTRLVESVRNAEKMLGSGDKIITPLEQRNMVGMKRSITTRIPVSKGTIITPDIVDFKRPATGLLPNEYEQIIGKRVASDLLSDHTLVRADILW